MAATPDTPAFWHQYLQTLDWMITSAPAYRLMRAAVVQGLAPTAGAAYLDLGCGTGGLLVDLLAAVPQCTAIGVDFSAAALAIAREKKADLALHELDFTKGLPFADRSFAGVASINSLYVACPRDESDRSSLSSVLGEIKRVLQPGGRLVISAPNPRGWGGQFFQKAIVGSVEFYALVLRYEGVRGLIRRSAQIWRNRSMVGVMTRTNRVIARQYEFIDQQQHGRHLANAGFQVLGVRRVPTGNLLIVAAAGQEG